MVQGAKSINYGHDVYPCRQGDYMTIPVTMPIVATVTEASPKKPYLCLQMDIDLAMAGEMFLAADFLSNSSTLAAKSLFVASMSEELQEPILRLAKLLDAPEDAGVLAPIYTREIYYRLLKSDHGQHIAHLTRPDGNLQKIGKVISHINQHYREAIRIDDLAQIANMSASGLHQKFKEITSLTPMQFQKHLRLIEARRSIILEGMGAAEAAYKVGYESASQFSREYARMFGAPPARDSGNNKKKFIIER